MGLTLSRWGPILSAGAPFPLRGAGLFPEKRRRPSSRQRTKKIGRVCGLRIKGWERRNRRKSLGGTSTSCADRGFERRQ